MQASINDIRKELSGLYPAEEIESFIRIIFSKLKQYTLTDLVLKQDEVLAEKEKDQIKQIAARLKNGEPIQYILGETEFYGLPFRVKPGVLIPRPETEELVHWVLKSQKTDGLRILDVGTGSGCIPISLKKHWSKAHIMACDISEEALEVARMNAGLNQTEIAFFHLNILNPLLPNSFPKIDILISNPPYVTESEKAAMNDNVLKYEPARALFVPDHDPLLFYRALAIFGKNYLTHGGKLFWEINESFGEKCRELLKEIGFSDVRLKKDLQGKNRMIFARYFES
ncbi:peptide chain release factor N(5)-glutamine methyltransferase [uncultured Sunxiuqinia sp.]|uniref:peptide chain release factor N(5)-glutamine methyltransferase n=1 Tax=uncultured Sunxiuqinia sp. TaxID=1573825 RepID=UPI0030DD1CA2|tara:strand:+ start:4337 stop:5188 length:852 start_codon:yes stop_codon:yes gene_type:complete